MSMNKEKGDEQNHRTGVYPKDWPLLDHFFHRFQVQVAELAHEGVVGWADQAVVMYLKLKAF